MKDFAEALYTAASLIGHRDPELREIRPYRPHKQAGHMTAPDQCCSNVRKFLPRHFATASCRIARDLFDHLVGSGEERLRETQA